MTHKAWWRGLVCFTLCSVLFVHTALPLFDSLLEQNAAGWAGTVAVAAVCKWHLSFSTSVTYFQAHFQRLSEHNVRREQYCFESPELTATNIRVQNSFSILCLTTDPIHQGHEKRKKSVTSARSPRNTSAQLRDMAQKIVSRQKHNMLSLLHAACLKLLFFFSMLLVREDWLCTCKCNNEALSRSRCCQGKAVRVTCFACVFAALVIQLEKRMSHVVACRALPDFSTLPHNGRNLGGEKSYWTWIVWFDFLYNICLKRFSF